MNTILTFASILVVSSGVWTLIRAYRKHTIALAFLGTVFIAIGFYISAMRVHDRTAAATFAGIAIIVQVAGMLWNKHTSVTE